MNPSLTPGCAPLPALCLGPPQGPRPIPQDPHYPMSSSEYYHKNSFLGEMQNHGAMELRDALPPITHTYTQANPKALASCHKHTLTPYTHPALPPSSVACLGSAFSLRRLRAPQQRKPLSLFGSAIVAGPPDKGWCNAQ